ncbi:hypothetical protein D9M68_875210 [compost metagenome]
MQLQTEFAELDLTQASVNDVQSGNLFRDKQHTLVLGQALSDEIGDRLALTGTWGADQHKILAPSCGHHGGQLR